MHGDQWPRLQFPTPTGTSCSYSIVLFLSFYSLWCCFSFVLTWSRDLRSQGGTWSVCFMLSVWFLNVIFWDTNDAVYVCFYIEHLVQRVGSKERAPQAEYIEGWGRGGKRIGEGGWRPHKTYKVGRLLPQRHTRMGSRRDRWCHHSISFPTSSFSCDIAVKSVT